MSGTKSSRFIATLLGAAGVIGLAAPGLAQAEDALGSWRGVVPDGQLAAASGLGLAVRGDGNAVAQAQANGTVESHTVADTISAGSIRALTLQDVSGLNVFQINTGQNVNQLVNQALTVEIINSPVPQR